MTWKSGERCRTAGVYRCQQCHLEGRATLRECQAGAVMPMCEACRDKDAAWRLIREAVAPSARS